MFALQRFSVGRKSQYHTVMWNSAHIIIISNAFSLAGFSLSSSEQHKPFYNTENLPPLIPLDQDRVAAVGMFPILNSASLEAQLGIAPSSTTSMSLEDAYQVIQEQGSQITVLDELVVQLQTEKVALEGQLTQCYCTGIPLSDTIHSNSTATMSTHRFVPVTPSPTVTTPAHHLSSSTCIATSTRAKIPLLNWNDLQQSV